MKLFRCYLVLIMLFLPICQFAEERARITISRVKPIANYSLTKDSSDIIQLTDGDTVKYPMWKQRLAVGWAKVTPIMLWANLHRGNRATDPISGRLRIHSVSKKKSEIWIPKRIDVYSNQGNDTWTHVGGRDFSSEGSGDGNGRWLEIDVQGSASKELFVVIHTRGDYLFVDEISFEYIGQKKQRIDNYKIDGYNGAVSDSLARLKETIKAKLRVKDTQAREWEESFGKSVNISWVEEPWGSLSGAPKAIHIKKRLGKKVKIVGVRNERESALIGILNNKLNSSLVTIQLHAEDALRSAIQIRKVKPVISADGKAAYDALLPSDFGEYIALSPKSASYIWLTFDLSRLPGGSYKAVIEIHDSGVISQIPVNITVVDMEVDSRQIHAINWAYPTDLPIWKDPKIVIDDLVSHGINVFVIPPKYIPLPPAESTKSKLTDFQTLIDAVKLYPKNSIFLLFLDWSLSRLESRHLKWLHPKTGWPIEKKRDVLVQWVRDINDAMASAGVSRENWFLYPIDEPNSKHIYYLQNLFALLKSVDKTIGIYANPIDTHSSPMQVDDLKAINAYIDQWQPKLQFAELRGRKFFQSLRSRWWVYDVPKSPAKSVPPSYYRIIAWRAWHVGASGIGFWSYSATRGSSAWDDLDGTQPDWAVVYEGERPISSRRWEAFREGIEDFRLLQHVVSPGSPLEERVHSALQMNISESNIEELRARLLGVLGMTE